MLYDCSFQLVRIRKTLSRGLCGFLLRELNLAARLLYFILVAYKIEPASSVVGLAFRNTRIPTASLTCSLRQIHPQKSQIGRKVTAGILQRETCVLFPADRETSCPSRADTTHFAHPASPKLKINRYALKTLHVSPAYTSPASRACRHENLSLQNAVDFCRRFQPRLRQPLAPSPATHLPHGPPAAFNADSAGPGGYRRPWNEASMLRTFPRPPGSLTPPFESARLAGYSAKLLSPLQPPAWGLWV